MFPENDSMKNLEKLYWSTVYLYILMENWKIQIMEGRAEAKLILEEAANSMSSLFMP